MGANGLAHEVFKDLMRVREELGRLPSRDEYLRHGKYPKSIIVETFGSWTKFIQASGLQYSLKGPRDKQEIREETFRKIQKEVEAKKLQEPANAAYRHVLVFPDMHRPYQHPDAIPFLIAIKHHYAKLGRPFDLTVDIGDGEDFHGINFHGQDPDLMSAGYELRKAIEAARPLYDEFPKLMICESNHGSLAYRKAKHHGIPAHVLKGYREMLEAPEGWTWHHEIIVRLSNGQECLFHHSLGSNVLQVSQKRGLNVVQGHHHSKLLIQYWQSHAGLYFGAQTGCLIDDTSMAFSYNKLTVDRPIMGCLRIEDGIPHLVPMLLDARGRWTGKMPS